MNEELQAFVLAAKESAQQQAQIAIQLGKIADKQADILTTITKHQEIEAERNGDILKELGAVINKHDRLLDAITKLINDVKDAFKEYKNGIEKCNSNCKTDREQIEDRLTKKQEDVIKEQKSLQEVYHKSYVKYGDWVWKIAILLGTIGVLVKLFWK